VDNVDVGLSQLQIEPTS